MVNILSKLYINKYKTDSTRLKSWDYKNSAIYYITLCTKNRRNFFASIYDVKNLEDHPIIKLTEIGEIVKSEWMKTSELRSDMNLELYEFVIMPNHFHALILIGENNYNRNNDSNTGSFGPQRKSLSSLIRGFKGSVTSKAKILNIDFAWQSGFYDRIIRNEKELQEIRKYIIYNPLDWKNDEEFNDSEYK